MTTLTYYHSPQCGGCREVEPQIRKAAKKNGWKFKKINIDECDTKTCNDIGWLPTVHIGRKELNEKELKALIDA